MRRSDAVLVGACAASLAIVGCAWVLAHDPVAPVAPGDSGGWEPPNTMQGYCGSPLGCPQGPGLVFMGAGLDGGCDG
jgi:hypothetical protein